MFYTCYGLNCDLSKWNVKNGIFFDGMFAGCQYFNSDLSKWNVKNGVDFNGMFAGCKKFFSDLSGWKMKVNNQLNLHKMFHNSPMISNYSL
jgi:surface protein